MEIVPYSDKYREQVQKICLETGPAAALTDPKIGSCILNNYCNYYIDNEAEHCFVLLDDDGLARGYILCAGDYHTYRSRFKPYGKIIRKNGGREYIEMLAEHTAMRVFSRNYPAHFHIDISDEFTGRGCGPKLMEALLSKLREENVSGVMLTAGLGNEGAIRFYRRLGFRTLISIFGGTVMGLRLDNENTQQNK